MKKLLLPLVAIIVSFTSCDQALECGPVITDDNANLNEFLGTWYEVATIPQFFSNQCECTSATYSVRPDGKVDVFNVCRENGVLTNIRGFAQQPNPNNFSKLKVKFPVAPFPADYWIIIFEAGSHMVVSDPLRSTCFILSRERTLDDAIYDSIIDQVDAQCIDINRIVRVNQDGCGEI